MEIAAAKAQAAHMRRARRLHVALLVADQHALRAVDRPRPHQIEDHAGPGLAPVGRALERDDRALRVERAMAPVVDTRALFRELLRDVVVQFVHLALGVKPAGDTGLVGGDEDIISGVVERLDRRDRARNPFELRPARHIAAIDIDDAVAIEKDGRLLTLHGCNRSAPSKIPTPSPARSRVYPTSGPLKRTRAGPSSL